MYQQNILINFLAVSLALKPKIKLTLKPTKKLQADAKKISLKSVEKAKKKKLNNV